MCIHTYIDYMYGYLCNYINMHTYNLSYVCYLKIEKKIYICMDTYVIT